MVALATSGCMAKGASAPAPIDVPDPTVDPAEPVLHRLTAAQYRNSVHDLFGEDIVIPGPLEPDSALGGLIATGASKVTISSWGVEQYERAAYEIAAQAMAEENRGKFISCTPAAAVDENCAGQTISELGRKIWRRPLDPEEVASLTAISSTVTRALGTFEAGMEFAVASMLQSPNFLFRVELGEPDPANSGARRYSSYEMATRLSYFFWNTTPDSTLLAAAESGALLESEGIAAEARRLLDSPRARAGMRNFFSEMFELYLLDEMVKDPTLFTHFSAELGESAREETLNMLERLVFDDQGDYRDIFTTNRTYVDRRLAAIYNVRAASREGFGEVMLTENDHRRGLLGHVSVLALNAHSVSSSATLRGKFVRTVLLCGEIPPPPVNVNTALPEPSGTAVTLRDRVKEHLTNPNCATCHLAMDPIGLGLENFDGIGRFREKEFGAMIDASSDVDGEEFTNAWELGAVLRDHPDVPRCLARTLYRYAIGNVEVPGEQEQIDSLAAVFANSKYRVRPLLEAIAVSKGFRRAKEPQL